MHTPLRLTSAHAAHRFVQFALTGFLAALPLGQATGQLAITEVMSNPSANGVQRDDFWELTNFGTNAIDLSSFWFRDDGGYSDAIPNLADLWSKTRADEPRIDPGESIIFVRSLSDVITTPEDFRQWWGEDRLAPDLKIFFYERFGFASTGDAVQLWQVTAESTNLVQRVKLLASLPGRTFTYDPTTGALETFSEAGVDGAFVAAATDDVGSPGFTRGPVPIGWSVAPSSTEVDAGSIVTLVVHAYGLPVPRYQWRFNDAPIPGATSNTFTLAPATSADAGQYSVELDNGLERRVTPFATLTVNTQPRCATIVQPPADRAVTPDQKAIFRVETRGYPLPTFQWQFEGVDIPGATNNTYAVVGANDSHVGLYCVRVTNALCSTNTCALLEVVPVPNLVITEAMAFPTNRVALRHDTWWELTNAGTNAVDLSGYRFDDAPPGLEGAPTVPNGVILVPGQSAIFVSSMTPAAFRRWWGEENLPADLPIISFPGNGLNRYGDVVTVWNATAMDNDDWLVSVSFVNLEAGVSLWFDPILAEFGEPSIEGQRGAFRAAESDDIGSPGWTTNRVIRPKITSIRYGLAGVALTWKTQTNRIYELQYCNRLAPQEWTSLRRLTADGDSLTTTDSTTAAAAQRFYRVELLSP